MREHRPVAALESGDGRRVAVASDGTLLPRSRRGSLPSVKVDAIPRGTGWVGRPPEERLVLVLAGARRSCGPSWTVPTGPRTAFGSRCATGPTLRFGAPSRLAAKWAAVTRVLADPSSGGASLLDVRLPERPAASFERPSQPGGAARRRDRSRRRSPGPRARLGCSPPRGHRDLRTRPTYSLNLSRGYEPSSTG